MSDDKVEILVRAIDGALHQTTVLFSMLLGELYGDEPEMVVDVTPPAPHLVASDNPIKCQHPSRMEVLGQELCDDCGANLSE